MNPMPVKLAYLSGTVTSATAVTIDLANLRDRNGQRIHWLPGHLLVLDVHRSDAMFPADWQANHGNGHTVAWHWLTATDRSVTFHVPDAGLVEWDGYVLSNVASTGVTEGGTSAQA